MAVTDDAGGLGSVLDRSRAGISQRPTLVLLTVVATMNVALGALFSISSAGLGPFLDDPGSWHYIAYHTILVTIFADLAMKNFDLVPGIGFMSRMFMVMVAMFIVFATGSMLASVSPVATAGGTFVSMGYYAGMAMLFTVMPVAMWIALTENSPVELQFCECH